MVVVCVYDHAQYPTTPHDKVRYEIVQKCHIFKYLLQSTNFRDV